MIHKQDHPRTCCYWHYAANFCCSCRLYWKFCCYRKCTLNLPQCSYPFIDPTRSHMFNIQSPWHFGGANYWWSFRHVLASEPKDITSSSSMTVAGSGNHLLKQGLCSRSWGIGRHYICNNDWKLSMCAFRTQKGNTSCVLNFN